MRLNGRHYKFPAKNHLSFAPLIKQLDERSKTCGPKEASYLEDLVSRATVLSKADIGLSKAKMKKHEALINELLVTLFPPTLTDNEIKAITPPWATDTIYCSSRFEKIMEEAGEDFQLGFDQISEDELYIAACTYILADYFGYPVPLSKSFYFDIPNTKTGYVRSYRLANNIDFVEIRPTSSSILISQDQYHQLMDNFSDIKLWKTLFPRNSWIFSGFNILNMMDLTRDRIITRLTTNLLNIESDGIDLLQDDLSQLLNAPLQLSFVSLKGSQLIHGATNNLKAMMLGEYEKADCTSLMCPMVYRQLIENRESVAIPDVRRYAQKSQSTMGENLLHAGLKSYFAAPVIYDGLVLGYLELGSKEKGVLNSATEPQLASVLPILAVAGNRMNQELENRIEAIIQSECTTIHPSVKWRFIEEANKHIAAEENGEEHNFSNLVFNDVFPLFGQLDIRNSSTIRNEGIKADLQEQLTKAKAVLESAQLIEKLPLYEEMIYMLDNHHTQLETEMISASEQDILHFINGEIEPVIKHLSTQNKNCKKAYDEYVEALHPELGFVYNERQSFDNAVNTANKVMSRYIDRKQVDAQRMFPHHFERYATDGLEFNMYIGESISPGQGFHPLMVKNLRLWQLMVMVEMEREYHRAKENLKKPLPVASLILAHSHSLSIQYRLDEKQFDVDGAYNARYEIIKKRIDKSHIKGTKERITQPSKMVVIYSTDEDEREYLRYFKFLQSKRYLETTKPEILVLEDLQGVSGLKALRLGVDYGDDNQTSNVSMQEIMDVIQGKENKEKTS